MPSKSSAIPSGCKPVMPYLRIKGAKEALAFYKKALGAKERFHLTMGDRVGHAEIDIGGSVVMLSDEFPEMGMLGPKALKGTTFTLAVMVKDCDAAVKKAVAAGAKVVRAPQDEFYGYRSSIIEDRFRHQWRLQQLIKDVPPKEMQKRLDAMMAQGGAAGSAPAKTVARKKG
jgi:PhnB protein